MIQTIEESKNRTKFKLDLDEVVKKFGENIALDGLTLKINPGEFVALLGPSGCGKTTALRIVAGLEQATSGDILINDQIFTSVPVQKRDIGMVFQNYSLFPNLTVFENIEYGLRVRKVGVTERATRVNHLLELVGLSHRAQSFGHQLSGGQQQRVALARALAIEPSVLLLDEPLSALDAQVRVQIREEIRRIQLELGITTLFVTHDQEEAMSIADRVGVMNQGRLEQIGKPIDIYNNPASAFVAGFVGSANKLRAIRTAKDNAKVLNQKISLSNANELNPESKEIDVLLRPESLVLCDTNDSHATEGKVVLASFLGPLMQIGITVADQPILHLTAQSKHFKNVSIGDSVWFKIDADSVIGSDV